MSLCHTGTVAYSWLLLQLGALLLVYTYAGLRAFTAYVSSYGSTSESKANGNTPQILSRGLVARQSRVSSRRSKGEVLASLSTLYRDKVVILAKLLPATTDCSNDQE